MVLGCLGMPICVACLDIFTAIAAAPDRLFLETSVRQTSLSRVLIIFSQVPRVQRRNRPQNTNFHSRGQWPPWANLVLLHMLLSSARQKDMLGPKMHLRGCLPGSTFCRELCKCLRYLVKSNTPLGTTMQLFQAFVLPCVCVPCHVVPHVVVVVAQPSTCFSQSPVKLTPPFPNCPLHLPSR